MSIEIYIGSPIKFSSERILLERAVQILAANGTRAVVLANFNVRTTQIDFVLATEKLTLLLEAKGCSTPLKGNTNGPWEVTLSGHQSKKTRNYYQQALDAGYTLRDELAAAGFAGQGYPKVALTIVPAIAVGSSLPPSDFKVGVASLDDLSTLLSQSR